MALAFSLTRKIPFGGRNLAYGTFTSASGDTSGAIAIGDHGINSIEQAWADLGKQEAQDPKVAISGTDVTLSTFDFQGLSGNWFVLGI